MVDVTFVMCVVVAAWCVGVCSSDCVGPVLLAKTKYRHHHPHLATSQTPTHLRSTAEFCLPPLLALAAWAAFAACLAEAPLACLAVKRLITLPSMSSAGNRMSPGTTWGDGGE